MTAIAGDPDPPTAEEFQNPGPPPAPPAQANTDQQPFSRRPAAPRQQRPKMGDR